MTLATNRSDSTPQTTNHPGDHNALAAAANSIDAGVIVKGITAAALGVQDVNTISLGPETVATWVTFTSTLQIADDTGTCRGSHDVFSSLTAGVIISHGAIQSPVANIWATDTITFGFQLNAATSVTFTSRFDLDAATGTAVHQGELTYTRLPIFT